MTLNPSQASHASRFRRCGCLALAVLVALVAVGCGAKSKRRATLVALDEATGKVVWQSPLSGGYGVAGWSGTQVVAGSADDCIRGGRGDVRLFTAAGRPGRVVESASGCVIFRATPDSLASRFGPAGRELGLPVVRSSGAPDAYVVGRTTRLTMIQHQNPTVLIAVDRASGRVVWRRRFRGFLGGLPLTASRGSSVVVATTSGAASPGGKAVVHVLDSSSGGTLAEVETTLATSFGVADGSLLVATRDGRATLVNLRTRRVIWRGAESEEPVALEHGRLYTSQGSTTRAVDLPTGRTIWSQDHAGGTLDASHDPLLVVRQGSFVPGAD